MQAFIEAKRTEIAELCRAHNVRRLSVFGSAVRDDFDPERSDVDVRVEFDESTGFTLDNYFELHDKLVEIFGREVDILSKQDIDNPYLRRIIENSQVTLYAA